MKWGNKYGPEYPNKLFRLIKKTYSKPFNFICITDNSDGLECDSLPLENWPHYNSTVFTIPKMDAFVHLPFEGPYVLLDLDVLVLRDLDRYFKDYNFEQPRLIWNYWDQIERLPITYHRGDCFVNSSFITWTGDQLKPVYDLFLTNRELFTYKFRSFDKFLYYCALNLFDTHPRKIVYSYNYGAENPDDLQPYKFREDYYLSIFNTSHDHGIELHDANGWAKQLWNSC